jgi:hypothetical protein
MISVARHASGVVTGRNRTRRERYHSLDKNGYVEARDVILYKEERDVIQC